MRPPKRATAVAADEKDRLLPGFYLLGMALVIELVGFFVIVLASYLSV